VALSRSSEGAVEVWVGAGFGGSVMATLRVRMTKAMAKKANDTRRFMGFSVGAAAMATPQPCYAAASEMVVGEGPVRRTGGGSRRVAPAVTAASPGGLRRRF